MGLWAAPPPNRFEPTWHGLHVYNRHALFGLGTGVLLLLVALLLLRRTDYAASAFFAVGALLPVEQGLVILRRGGGWDD